MFDFAGIDRQARQRALFRAAMVLAGVATLAGAIGFLINWLVASAFIAGYLFLALQISNMAGGAASAVVLIPQLAVAILR